MDKSSVVSRVGAGHLRHLSRSDDVGNNQVESASERGLAMLEAASNTKLTFILFEPLAPVCALLGVKRRRRAPKTAHTKYQKLLL
jgi:hypothetical protein